MRRLRMKLIVSSIITFLAGRIGLEPMLAALGIGPNAIGIAEWDSATSGFRFLWMGMVTLLASVIQFVLRKLAAIPIFAEAFKVCARNGDVRPQQDSISAN